MVETNTPQPVDVAGECLLYYELMVDILGQPDIEIMKSRKYIYGDLRWKFL